VGPFGASAAGTAAGLVFTALLVAAAVGDIRTRRIPNKLVLSIGLLGIVYAIASKPVIPGAFQGVGGILIGLGCWLPFYALGWVGAGDVKLFAAAGAWLGPMRALEGAIIAALAGAILALVWMVRSRGVKETAETLAIAAGSPAVLSPADARSRRSKLPYGVAIALGAIWAGWLPRLLIAE
jgi:prepilin peptidase CpaA